jgi:hypothetical protein
MKYFTERGERIKKREEEGEISPLLLLCKHCLLFTSIFFVSK